MILEGVSCDGIHMMIPDCARGKKRTKFDLCHLQIKPVIKIVPNITDNRVDIDDIRGTVL